MKEFEEYKSTKVRFTSEKNNKQSTWSRQYEPLSITHKNTALEYIYYQNFSSSTNVCLPGWMN